MGWIRQSTCTRCIRVVYEGTWAEVSDLLCHHQVWEKLNCAVGAAEDVKKKYGDITNEAYYQDLFKDGPSLCGQTCSWLASGQGKELRGLFLGELFQTCRRKRRTDI